MRMSHIYQPVMLMTLLGSSDGESTEEEIARAILSLDESQIEYYGKITRDMVGRVLRNHQVVDRRGKNYSLLGYENLSKDQVESLIELCKAKLAACERTVILSGAS
jgi:hypothetical protein